MTTDTFVFHFPLKQFCPAENIYSVPSHEGVAPWRTLEIPAEPEEVPEHAMLLISNRFFVPKNRTVANFLALGFPRLPQDKSVRSCYL